ncbi:MAG TPA: response regulator [Azospirillaceae bacterium]|nr:response regulator [Azospirillaceae bacterium]
MARVLIVEDEAIIALHLQFIAKRLGHTVCALAGTSAQAVDAIDRHEPDLVLLDLFLASGSTGVEVADHLRRRSGTPYVLVTGNVSDPLMNMLGGNPPVRVVGKPFGAHQIEQAIVEALGAAA